MTKATVCLATAFSAVFAIGCSSSSSNNDGGGAAKDSALPMFADANGNPLMAPVGGACPGLPCTLPQKCCLNPLSMTGLCQDPTATCGGILTGCASPSECMDPQVCCGSAGGRGGGPGAFSIACTDPAQCVAQDGGGFVFRLCDSTHSCPTGQTCMAPPGRGGGGGMGMFCFSPGMFGMRPEAGAPEGGQSEAGPSEAGPSEAGPSEAGPSDAGAG
jgi:hypothetical protein